MYKGNANIGSVIANAAGNALRTAGTHSARAAATANGVSAGAQAAQGAFNQNSANIANGIGDNRIAEQYGFNSGQAALANQFTSDMWGQSAAWNEAMWEKAAAWNEMMWQRQADFNSREAQKNRDWQKMMAETSYQRAVADMQKAGINPILASGGVGASAGGGGSAASVGGASMGNPTMSGANGAMASGGLMNGISASESSYTGQMEYMAGMLGLLSTGLEALASAKKYFDQAGVTDKAADLMMSTLNGFATGATKGTMSKGFTKGALRGALTK